VRSARGETLFDPEWGSFDLACGKTVSSVFGGASDRSAYLSATGGFKQAPGKQKTNLTEQNKDLNTLYERVRKLRESYASASHPPGSSPPSRAATAQALAVIHAALEARYPSDWLLRYELLEFDFEHGLESAWREQAKSRLLETAKASQTFHDLIHRGLELLS
jgi:phenylalanine-4-hydroxylase